MAPKQVVVLILAASCFCLPMLVVVGTNWEQFQPYLAPQGDTATGHLVYLYKPG